MATSEDPSLPLSGISVLDITSNIAGPFAGVILADLGADVIKIEQPGGDPARRMVPLDGDRSAYFHVVNRNKSAVSLNLKDPLDRATLDKMMTTADVLLSNHLPARAAALNLTPERIARDHPHLIYGVLTAYGSSGADSSLPGFDAVLQARTGIAAVTGEPDGNPVRTGVSVLDLGSGMWLASAVLAALFRRTRTGRGGLVETSLFETGVNWVCYHILAHQLTGTTSARHGSGHPAFAPYGIFQTRDRGICIGIGSDPLFTAFCAAIDRPDLSTDPRFVDNSSRSAHRDELRKIIEETLAASDSWEWLGRLRAAGVPVDEVKLPEDLLQDEQVRATNMLLEYPGDGFTVLMPGLPITFEGHRPPVRMSAPHLPAKG